MERPSKKSAAALFASEWSNQQRRQNRALGNISPFRPAHGRAPALRAIHRHGKSLPSQGLSIGTGLYATNRNSLRYWENTGVRYRESLSTSVDLGTSRTRAVFEIRKPQHGVPGT